MQTLAHADLFRCAPTYCSNLRSSLQAKIWIKIC